MPFDPDDPRFTAFALGELEPADREAIEALLADDPEGRAFVLGIEETARLLTDRLHQEATDHIGLDSLRREAIEQQITAASPVIAMPETPVKPKRQFRITLIELAVAASIIGVAISLILPAQQAARPSARRRTNELVLLKSRTPASNTTSEAFGEESHLRYKALSTRESHLDLSPDQASRGDASKRNLAANEGERVEAIDETLSRSKASPSRSMLAAKTLQENSGVAMDAEAGVLTNTTKQPSSNTPLRAALGRVPASPVEFFADQNAVAGGHNRQVSPPTTKPGASAGQGEMYAYKDNLKEADRYYPEQVGAKQANTGNNNGSSANGGQPNQPQSGQSGQPQPNQPQVNQPGQPRFGQPHPVQQALAQPGQNVNQAANGGKPVINGLYNSQVPIAQSGFQNSMQMPSGGKPGDQAGGKPGPQGQPGQDATVSSGEGRQFGFQVGKGKAPADEAQLQSTMRGRGEAEGFALGMNATADRRDAGVLNQTQAAGTTGKPAVSPTSPGVPLAQASPAAVALSNASPGVGGRPAMVAPVATVAPARVDPAAQAPAKVAPADNLKAMFNSSNQPVPTAAAPAPAPMTPKLLVLTDGIMHEERDLGDLDKKTPVAVEAKIAAAKADVARAEDRVKLSEKGKEMGYLSESARLSEQLNLKKAQFALEQTLTEREVQQKIAEPKATTETLLAKKEAEIEGIQRQVDALKQRQLIEQTRVNREAYARQYDNPFVNVVPGVQLSTFAVDVDTASYANIRRFLSQGQLPPVDAVRIEEMINYFSYNDPAPKGDVPFSVNLEAAGCPWDAGHRLVRIGLKGRTIANDKRPMSNLVFLIDTSGSMADLNKLPFLKAGMKLLVEQLTENDRVAIVTYSNEVRLALPSTPCHRKAEILAVLDSLKAEGGTNGGAGIQKAYATAQEFFIKGGTNRVILATDGDFNVGLSKEELLATSEERAKSGVCLSVLGFGEGNIQEDFMEQLADKGNGNFSYIDNIDEARKVLVRQMSGTLVVIAKDVKVQVEFNPNKVAAFRLIGYENRVMANEDFRNDKKDAGEIGAGHHVTALYEVVPSGTQNAAVIADRPLKYKAAAAEVDKKADVNGELLTVSLRFKQPDGDRATEISQALTDGGREFARGSTDLKFAASVAGFGMLLRESPYKGTITLPAVHEIASTALGEDPNGDRKQFLGLVKQAEQIVSPQAP